MADLERISSDVKYDYPIELVTIQKTIAVIDLDSEPEIGGATAHMQVEAMQVDATADDDLIVIDEVRHTLQLKTFFKMTSDSIQQIRFS